MKDLVADLRFQLLSRTGWVSRIADTDLTDLWMKGIKLVLSLLILTILLALTGGVVKTFLDLHRLLSSPLEVALRHVIVDTLILLAVVEVFKTTLTYFSEGRVKVTFIVDTILVVMLTEIISHWFKGGDLIQFGVLGAILIVLVGVRVLTVRFSPTQEDTNVPPALHSQGAASKEFTIF